MSERPLSPHLQIYRLPLAAILSISHRITGVGLCAGALWLVVFLCALASGPAAFACINAFHDSILGKIALIGMAFCLFFHLSNGVRHLIWDTGRGLDLATTRQTNFTVLLAAILLTIFFVGLAAIHQ